MGSCGLTTRTAWPSSSSTLNTGHQYTPVLSMATCSTCCVCSQALNARKDAVMVLNVRTCRCTRPSACVLSTQATTVSLWTSNPQHRSYTTCMVPLLGSLVTACALLWPGWGAGSPQVSFTCSCRGDMDMATLFYPGRTPRSG